MRRSMKQERIALKKAVARFAKNMLARLYQKAEKGYRGWDGKFPALELISQIRADVDRASRSIFSSFFINSQRDSLAYTKLCLDIANRTMMLWWRANGKNYQPTPAERQLAKQKPKKPTSVHA